MFLTGRFLLIACRRVRLLPEGGDPDPLAGTGLSARLKASLAAARHAGRVVLTERARSLWWDCYAGLSEPDEGPAGALCARAEAHTVRLALIYALIDGARRIGRSHLEAALALWGYARRSARWTIGESSGDPIAERLHAALAAAPAGLTRTQLRDLLQRNHPGERIDAALSALASSGRARRERVLTGGRPAELWRAQEAARRP